MAGDLFSRIQGGLVVSCQAHEGEPLHGSIFMRQMAIASKEAGAVGLRVNGTADIEAIQAVCDLPIIGILKRNYRESDVYITPSSKEVSTLLDTGCEMIALDATLRPRPNGESLRSLVQQIHDAGKYCMADCATVAEAMHAAQIGFDCVATTLAHHEESGYNIKLAQDMVNAVSCPVIAEGGIHCPRLARQLIDLGVHCVVVGGAITRPQQIAKTFVEALRAQ